MANVSTLFQKQMNQLKAFSHELSTFRQIPNVAQESAGVTVAEQSASFLSLFPPLGWMAVCSLWVCLRPQPSQLWRTTLLIQFPKTTPVSDPDRCW